MSSYTKTKSIQIGGMSRHVNTSESTHQDQEENEKPPGTTNRPLEAILRSNWGAIKTYFKCRKVQDIFNFRLINQKRDLKRSLTNICICICIYICIYIYIKSK